MHVYLHPTLSSALAMRTASTAKTPKTMTMTTTVPATTLGLDLPLPVPALSTPTSDRTAHSGSAPTADSAPITAYPGSADASPALIDPDALRTRFSTALSGMYRAEVPLYGDLLELVAEVNARSLSGAESESPTSTSIPTADLSADPTLLHRLTIERHGAVRVGSPRELRLLARTFALMGMAPVGYYDLHRSSGLPIHATAFRPLAPSALAANPFRVFTSVLRVECIADAGVRALAEEILASRRIAPPGFEDLLAACERAGGVPTARADAFVSAALEIFRWHSSTRVSKSTYERLRAAHPLVADIVCFRGPHVNHLTPRSVDIDAVQGGMRERGMDAKEEVEGPPGGRRCEVLLRQTSFKARCEAVYFLPDGSDSGEGGEATVYGHHTARFGEIEARGAALTSKGMQWYEARLARATRAHQREQPATASYDATLRHYFADFPDDWAALRREGLAYFRYGLASPARAEAAQLAEAEVKGQGSAADLVRALVRAGCVTAQPITYEDFLPASAAGIFSSNLGEDGAHAATDGSDGDGIDLEESDCEGKARLERECGMEVRDVHEVYEEMQRGSVAEMLGGLGTEVQGEEEMEGVMNVLRSGW